MLAGCGSDSSTSGADSDQKVVKFMHIWPPGSSKTQNQIVETVVKNYEKDHPKVKVQVEYLENEQYKDKIKVLSSSNDLPDVGMTWAAGYLQPFVEGNLVAPLDDVLEKDNLKDEFVGGTTEAYSIDGKTYGLPIELNIAPIYYNKEIFEKNGLEVPKNYDEFKNVVKTLKEKGVTPIALGNKDGWTGSLWYMYLADRIGGTELISQAISQETSFEGESLEKAADEFQKIAKMGGFSKGTNGLTNDEAKVEFLNETAAMYLMGSWELPNFTTSDETTQEFKDKIGYFNFPEYTGGKGTTDSWVGGPGVGLFVAENSKVKDESKEFVNYFIKEWGKQSMPKAGVIPATKVDTASLDLPQMNIDILNELSKTKNITLYADVQMPASAAEVHYDLLQSLVSGSITPEEFTKKTETSLKEAK
ncbi:MAG: extracellular solute-binding protein [Kurthia sp.]|nr:extracellular solute-binding protein [Candidatus Kurthia equi]